MTGYDFPPADNGRAPGQARHRLDPVLVIAGATTRHRPADLRPHERHLGDGPSWLGALRSPRSTSGGKARENMDLAVSDRPARRPPLLLKTFDKIDREVDRSGLMTGLDSFEGQAFDLILSRAREVFESGRKTRRRRDRYGTGPRRATAAGPPTVRGRRRLRDVNFGGWDMHGDIADAHEAHSARRWIRPWPRSSRTCRPRAGQEHPAGRHRRVRPHAAHQQQCRPRPLGPPVHPGPGRRRAEDGTGGRRIQRQGRSAQDARQSRRRT